MGLNAAEGAGDAVNGAYDDREVEISHGMMPPACGNSRRTAAAVRLVYDAVRMWDFVVGAVIVVAGTAFVIDLAQDLPHGLSGGARAGDP